MRLITPILSVALVLAFAGVGWLLVVEHEQARQIAKLKAEVVDKSAQQSLALGNLKRQCAADADRYFKKWNGAQTPSTAQVGYESQYNPSRKACFVLIQYSDPSREDLGLQLFDAVEQRQYADFSSQKEFTLSCRLIPSDGEQKPCSSKASFSAFVAGYMEAAPDLP
jgi:hypothetical protein